IMIRIAFCLALCAALAACASGASRDPDDRRSRPRDQGLRPAGLLLASFDSDGDYRIAPAELEAGIGRAFASADTDDDGAVSLIELGDFRARAFGAREALPGPFTFDANQDGAVSRAEFAAALNATAADHMAADGAIPFSALVTDPRAGRELRRGGADGVELIQRGRLPDDY